MLKKLKTVSVYPLFLALWMVAIIAFIIWSKVNSESPILWYQFCFLTVMAAACAWLLVYSLVSKIFDHLEELKADMMVVNGFSLEAISRIIAFVWKEALEAGLLGPESVANGGANINLPANIQEKMDLIFAWLQTPSHRRGFKTGMKLLNFLEDAQKRVEYFKEMI